MRKHYIDNLRWFCILLLFPYHAAMVFNVWSENFYIFSQPVKPIAAFIIATYPWFMPLLFVLAGISSYYALQKRTNWQYVQERISKLLIPLVFGILLLVPVQTYFAERFHNQYSGSYFAQYTSSSLPNPPIFPAIWAVLPPASCGSFYTSSSFHCLPYR